MMSDRVNLWLKTPGVAYLLQHEYLKNSYLLVGSSVKDDGMVIEANQEEECWLLQNWVDQM